MATQKW